MRLEWKIAVVTTLLIVIFLAGNCATRKYRLDTHEEFVKIPTDLSPLPENLLVLPDSSAKDICVLYFRIAYFYTSPYGEEYYHHAISRSVYADGRIEINFHIQSKQTTYRVGHIKIADVQNLLHMLNNKGFFKITQDVVDTEKGYIKETYCFGCLTGVLSKIYSASFEEYTVRFQLKNYSHEIICPYIIEDVMNDDKLIELQILKESLESTVVYLHDKMEISED
jgi:hypothetical protein